jgi:Family of unknown function (DUF5335)
MSLREIPSSDWPAFLQQFSRDHRAWLATVDHMGPGASHHVAASERPLRAVTADLAAGSVVGIEIQLQQDPQAQEAVRVTAPVRLCVDETPRGAARGLEIEDERGARTRIRFRVPAPPGLLDGVAPGEL